MSELVDFSADQLRSEVSRLRAEVSELRQALETAVRDKATITAERDRCLQHLEMFWAERIADMDENGIDLGEFIAELERDLDTRGMPDGK